MAKKPHDDLFEKSTMTFGEHLEELRVCLFRGVVGVALGCIIGLVVASSVVRFFQGPLESAMEEYFLANALRDVDKKIGDVGIEEKRMILDEKLVPEALEIDAGRLAAALRLTYPEDFGGLSVSPYAYTANDFLEGGAERLCRAWAGSKDRTGSPGHRCWELLSASQQKTVEQLTQAGGPLSAAQQAEVVQLLNSLAGQRALHEAPEFSQLSGSDAGLAGTLTARVAQRLGYKAPAGTDTVSEIREQLEKQFDPQQSRRLNKLLLARAFPDELHKARVSTLTLFTWKPVRVKFQTLSATEPFMIWMKAALMTGLVLASPYVFYQIWIFVAAGLYPHEKHYVFLYLPVSLALFFGGASLAFLFVFKPVLSFLFTFNQGMNAEFEPRIGEWLNFVLILPLGFGISFQLPLVMLFLNRLGLVSIDLYVQQWRVAILAIAVISMVLTPADPISMMLMAVPLSFLYLLGLLMCKYMPRGRSPFEEAYEP